MPLVARLPSGDRCLLGEGDAVEFFEVDEAQAERIAEAGTFVAKGPPRARVGLKDLESKS